MSGIKGVKHLSITIQYRTQTDLKKQLMFVLHNAKNGVERLKYTNKLSREKTEYDLVFLNELHFEEKIINGKLTMVIQSKMNK